VGERRTSDLFKLTQEIAPGAIARNCSRCATRSASESSPARSPSRSQTRRRSLRSRPSRARSNRSSGAARRCWPRTAAVNEWDEGYKRLVVQTLLRPKDRDPTPAEIAMFAEQVQRTGLDPFLKQIYGIYRFDSRAGGEVLQTQVGIDGFRLIAHRTGLYEGQDGPYWCGPDGEWRDVWLDTNRPAAAKVGVWRTGARAPVWGVARFASVRAAQEGRRPHPASGRPCRTTRSPSAPKRRRSQGVPRRAVRPLHPGGARSPRPRQPITKKRASARSRCTRCRPASPSTTASPTTRTSGAREDKRKGWCGTGRLTGMSTVARRTTSGPTRSCGSPPAATATASPLSPPKASATTTRPPIRAALAWLADGDSDLGALSDAKLLYSDLTEGARRAARTSTSTACTPSPAARPPPPRR
jgi:hypothetical protein